MKLNPALAALPVTAFIVGMTGCSQHVTVTQTTRTHISGSAAGHKFTADLSGDASIDSQPDHATISSQFGPIVIERSHVTLGTNQWTNIPDGVPLTLDISPEKYSVQWTKAN